MIFKYDQKEDTQIEDTLFITPLIYELSNGSVNFLSTQSSQKTFSLAKKSLVSIILWFYVVISY